MSRSYLDEGIIDAWVSVCRQVRGTRSTLSPDTVAHVAALLVNASYTQCAAEDVSLALEDIRNALKGGSAATLRVVS